ncbi:hypothetical protein AGMMS49959_07510 [Planctomycetales bacterium]|nr:hypothetical protein AGMMS49959_07510 [Planctomycetales bacterium]
MDANLIARMPAHIRRLATEITNFDLQWTANMRPSDNISRKRLRLAFWICKNQGIPPDDENLAVIIGSKFREVVPFITEIARELSSESGRF